MRGKGKKRRGNLKEVNKGKEKEGEENRKRRNRMSEDRTLKI